MGNFRVRRRKGRSTPGGMAISGEMRQPEPSLEDLRLCRVADLLRPSYPELRFCLANAYQGIGIPLRAKPGRAKSGKVWVWFVIEWQTGQMREPFTVDRPPDLWDLWPATACALYRRVRQAVEDSAGCRS